jgi:hypothetical protein
MARGRQRKRKHRGQQQHRACNTAGVEEQAGPLAPSAEPSSSCSQQSSEAHACRHCHGSVAARQPDASFQTPQDNPAQQRVYPAASPSGRPPVSWNPVQPEEAGSATALLLPADLLDGLTGQELQLGRQIVRALQHAQVGPLHVIGVLRLQCGASILQQR